MRATIANLEKEEKGILDDFKAGYKHGHSMRQHLNNIRRDRLFEAIDDCDNFEGYCKLKRLPIGSMSGRRLYPFWFLARTSGKPR